MACDNFELENIEATCSDSNHLRVERTQNACLTTAATHA